MDGREDPRQALGAPHFNTRSSRDEILRILQLAASDEVSFDRLTEAMEGCAGVPFAVIRAANSALIGAPQEVRSLRQAIVMLGLRRIRGVLAEQLEQVTSERRERVAG